MDRPHEEAILVSMDRVVECADEFPNVSWRGKTEVWPKIQVFTA